MHNVFISEILMKCCHCSFKAETEVHETKQIPHIVLHAVVLLSQRCANIGSGLVIVINIIITSSSSSIKNLLIR